MKTLWLVAIVGAVMCGGAHIGSADMQDSRDKIRNTTGKEPLQPSPGAIPRPTIGTFRVMRPSTIDSTQYMLKEKQYCEAAKTVLSTTKSRVACDGFLTEIGSHCDSFIPNFRCKVMIANAVCSSNTGIIDSCRMNVLEEINKNSSRASGKIRGTGAEEQANAIYEQAKGNSNKISDQNITRVPPTIDPSKVMRPRTIGSTNVQAILLGADLAKKQQEYCEAAKTVLSSAHNHDAFGALHAEIGGKCELFISGFWCQVIAANPAFKGDIGKFDCRG